MIVASQKHQAHVLLQETVRPQTVDYLRRGKRSLQQGTCAILGCATQNGFTLLEVLLSVSIIAMLAGISLPIYLTYSNRNDLTLATETTANALRRAEAYSRGVKSDSQWGVEVQSGQITVFKGASYAARDASYDETTAMPTTINPSGTTSFVFSKLSGTPNAVGSLSLTSTNLNETKTVTINAKGTVEY